MFSSKVMKAIACEVEDDKMEMIERLKIFLKEKIDGDYEEIDEWIDEFAKGEFDGSRKKSSKKSSSPKKKRKQSHYNHFFGICQQQITSENLENTTKMTRAERCAEIKKRWNELKSQPDYPTIKKQWENERDAKLGLTDSSDGGGQFLSLMVTNNNTTPSDEGEQFLSMMVPVEKGKEEVDEDEEEEEEEEEQVDEEEEEKEKKKKEKEERKKKEKEERKKKGDEEKEKKKKEKEERKKKEKEEKEATGSSDEGDGSSDQGDGSSDQGDGSSDGDDESSDGETILMVTVDDNSSGDESQ